MVSALIAQVNCFVVVRHRIRQIVWYHYYGSKYVTVFVLKAHRL
jgi:hypothetical protein